MNSRVAFLFPGQGAQSAALVSQLISLPGYDGISPLLRTLLNGSAPESLPPAALNSNLTSSLLTVTFSALCWNARKELNLPTAPSLMAGYSVGTFTALFAAGSFSLEELLQFVSHRSKLMDAAIAQTESCMVGCIGLTHATVESICGRLRDSGSELWISNYNAPGQQTIAASRTIAAELQQQLLAAGAKKVAALPLAGGWHSPFLSSAEPKLKKVLSQLPLTPPTLPVIDNVTGTQLPQQPDQLRAQLLKQLTAPVQWELGVRTMLDDSVDTFIECGYGSVLSRFGFFIDRSKQFRSPFPEPRPAPPPKEPVCAE